MSWIKYVYTDADGNWTEEAEAILAASRSMQSVEASTTRVSDETFAAIERALDENLICKTNE